MKRILAIFLSLVLVMGLTACGSPGQENMLEGREEGQGGEQVEQNAASPDEPVQGEEPTLPDDEVAEADRSDCKAADEPEENGAASITASHTDVTLRAPGNSFRMTYQGGESGYTAAYASADPSVASVLEDGTVTAVGPGTTTVSMYVEGNGVQLDFACIVRCAWKEDAAEQPSDEKQGLDEFFAALQTSYEGLGAMMVYEGELLDSYYAGLSGISTRQMLVQETMMSMSNCAVALVEVSDSADVEAVKAILQARAKTQAEGGAWYPASCETWEQAVIVSAGNYVGMFVYPDNAQAMADAFTAVYDK